MAGLRSPCWPAVRRPPHPRELPAFAGHLSGANGRTRTGRASSDRPDPSCGGRRHPTPASWFHRARLRLQRAHLQVFRDGRGWDRTSDLPRVNSPYCFCSSCAVSQPVEREAFGGR